MAGMRKMRFTERTHARTIHLPAAFWEVLDDLAAQLGESSSVALFMVMDSDHNRKRLLDTVEYWEP